MDAAYAGPDRRGQHPWRRRLLWVVAPIDSNLVGCSLNRLLAIVFGSAAIRGAHWKGVGISTQDVAMAVVAGSLAFGPHIFEMFLEHRDSR